MSSCIHNMIYICLIFCIAGGSIILRTVTYIQTTQCTYLHTDKRECLYKSKYSFRFKERKSPTWQ